MNNLLEALFSGNKRACSKIITMIENETDGYENILKEIHKNTQGAYIIGITGPPGAGKSTFTDKLVKLIRKEDKKVGIIAIDPTSPFTKGAILGDRIRMNDLTLDKGVFIRSMGTRGSLGGLSSATQGAIKALDAYGCDYIIIETVGVGQSEVDIVKTADTTVMVMVPGLGDDIQAIKAGVMEIADVFVVNKADKDGSKRTSIEINTMLDFKKDWSFRPPLSLAIAESGEGIEEALENIKKHKEHLYISNEILTKRLERNKVEVKEVLNKKFEKLVSEIEANADIESLIEKTISKETDPYTIGQKIFESVIK